MTNNITNLTYSYNGTFLQQSSYSVLKHILILEGENHRMTLGEFDSKTKSFLAISGRAGGRALEIIWETEQVLLLPCSHRLSYPDAHAPLSCFLPLLNMEYFRDVLFPRKKVSKRLLLSCHGGEGEQEED